MNSLQLSGAALMGLLGSAHCVAMCGGVVCVLGASLPSELRRKPSTHLPFSFAYNFGRIVSYACMGAVVGGLGAVVADVFPVHIAQLSLRVLATLLMLGLGLHLLGVWSSYARIERIGAPLWRALQPWTQKLFAVRTVPRAVGLGLLWGAMPCGLVYAAFGLALSSHSALGGALTMLAFGLGTLPALLTVGAFTTQFMITIKRPWVRRTAGVIVLVLTSVNLYFVLPAVRASLGHGATSATCSCHCG